MHFILTATIRIMSACNCFYQGATARGGVGAIVAAFAVFVICAKLLPTIPPQLRFEYCFAPSRAPPSF